MEDFFSFRRMLTPVLIQIIFWIGLLTVGIVGVVMMARGQAVVGLVVWALGFLLVRVYAELLIVIFRINDTLADIRDALSRGNVAMALAHPAGRELPGAGCPGGSATGTWGTSRTSVHPEIGLSPASGSPGETVTARLRGFPSGNQIRLSWVVEGGTFIQPPRAAAMWAAHRDGWHGERGGNVRWMRMRRR